MRNSSFNFGKFVEEQLKQSKIPLHPASLLRPAIMSGAEGDSEKLRKKLREHCSMLASRSDFVRLMVKDKQGYHYMCKEQHIEFLKN